MRFILILLVICCGTPIVGATSNLLVIGDSLSAGYGIPAEKAWPALLARRLAEHGYDYNVRNLSISGETTAGGRSRLSAALEQYRPKIVILALGANDGLRGLPLAQMGMNLRTMITETRRIGAKVLLVSMRLPPNYGPYAEAFAETFHNLSQESRIPLLPFLLAPIAEKREFFQADQLHPTAEAQPLLLNHLWPALVPLLKPVGGR